MVRGLCNPEIPWSAHLSERESCGDDPAMLKALHATTDAEIEVAGESRVRDLMAMRTKVDRDESLPLACGVDVQHDRIEATLAQAAGERLEVLSHAVLWGDTHDADGGAWTLLGALLDEHLANMTLVDSGDGRRTRTVYAWTGRRRGCYAVKGRKTLDGGLWRKSPARPGEGKPVDLVLLDVDSLRRMWQARLAAETRAAWFAFDLGLDADYFKSLTAEREIVERNPRTGAWSRKWITTGDNEASDTMTYAQAAALIAQRWRTRQAAWSRMPATMPAPGVDYSPEAARAAYERELAASA